MKNNHLSLGSLSGAWALNPAHVPEVEFIANQLFSGNVTVPMSDTKEILAAAYYDIQENAQPQEKRIAIIPMRGLLMAYGNWYFGADDYLQIFRAYNNSDQIAAVVIDMNGPGSSVDAINMMREFASEKKKPFVVLANSCYSGHLWTAALLADHIMAYGNVTSGFGSIGVLSMGLDYRKNMENQGVKMQIIRAPQSTTKAQSTVDFYEGKDEAFIQAEKDAMFPMAEAFINEMKILRPNLKLETEGLFTGSIYGADEALQIGLIDSIGNEKKAIEMAQMLVDLEIY